MNCDVGAVELAAADNHTAYQSARMALERRARRAEHFDSRLFADPPWDVLLHLFVHQHASDATSATALASVAGVGPSTMQRWLALMEQDGLVVGSSDGETTFRISAFAKHSMLDLLSK